MSWTALPTGQDVNITPGLTYLIVASIGKNMTQSDVMSHVPDGVEVEKYAEQGDGTEWAPTPDPDSSRKRIGVIAYSASYSGTLSWSKSILWSNLYTLVGVWTSPPEATGNLPAIPPIPAGRVTSPSPWPWVIAGVAITAAGFGVWKYHRDRTAVVTRGRPRVSSRA